VSIEPDALKALESHKWPGNIRELENAMERAVALESGGSITSSSLEGALRSSEPAGPAAAGVDFPDLARGPVSLDHFLSRVERELVRRALLLAKGSDDQAARLLQTTRARIANASK
jgi:DNA-binding NtrC family response regulator